MRLPRWRLFGSVALVLVGIWAWSSTISDHSKWGSYRHLYTGVTTTANVLSYSYDPTEGIQAGGPTDQVAFVTSTGDRKTATVGHHDPGTEETTHALPITYDPPHPDVVIAADVDVAPTDGSEWWGGLLVALPSTVGAVGLGLWILIGLRRPMISEVSIRSSSRCRSRR